MDEWKRADSTLPANHGWRARSGYSVFVAGAGAVRFDFPSEWVLVPEPACAHLYDRRPPDDESHMIVSYARRPEALLSAVSLASMLQEPPKIEAGGSGTLQPIVEILRGDLRIAWRTYLFADASQQRAARSHICIARQGSVLCQITFDFWESDLTRASAAWDIALDSLMLGGIADPELGIAHP